MRYVCKIENVNKILKSQIYKIRLSKDEKILASNFGYLSLLQVAGYFFPLVTMPYLARVIGTSGFGKIAFATSVVVWFQTIADWGFNLTATRDVAQNRENKEAVSRLFSNVLWARCLLTFVSGIILLFFVVFVPYFRENAAVLFATFLMVPGHIFFPDWFFQAIERMKYTTIFNLLIKLLFTIAVFIVIKAPDDYIWSPLLTSIGYLICGICSLFIILKKWEYRLYKPVFKDILQTIKDSTDVFVNNLMPNLYNSFSVVLLGVWGGSVVNGIYEGGNKFPTFYYNLQSVLSRSFFPFLSRKTNKHKIFAKLNIGVSIVGTIILFFLSPFLIRSFLGVEFSESIPIMRIMSISIIFLAMSNTYGTNYLIIRHYERELREITMIASIIGMVFAIPMVYYFQAIGVALIVTFSRGLLGILSLWKYLKVENNNIQ